MRRSCGVQSLAALAALTLLGCTTGREQGPGPAVTLREESVEARYDYECDTVSGRTVCVMTGNALLPLTPRYPMLTLGAMKSEERGAARYFLRLVAINHGSWVDIPRGPSLRLTIDGEPLELSGDGSSANRMAGEGGKHFEAATYAVPPELIARIGGATSVMVRVEGGAVVEKRFGPANQAHFSMFRRTYMGGAPAGK
jgi:hypothetical protein